MPGGVAGAQLKAAPYADPNQLPFMQPFDIPILAEPFT
jgi:hypothetical protein